MTDNILEQLAQIRERYGELQCDIESLWSQCGGAPGASMDEDMFAHYDRNHLLRPIIALPEFENMPEWAREAFKAGQFFTVVAKEFKAMMPYLKEYETPSECIIRNRKDMSNSIKITAEQMKRAQAAEAQVSKLRDALTQIQALNNRNNPWDESDTIAIYCREGLLEESK